MDDVLAPAGIEYPESDGSPIAESDWHLAELIDLLQRLRARYAERPDTYVAGHMFVYYEEGDPASVFAPDVMVVFGVPKTERRVYKLWEELRAPTVVFEVSSRKTWLVDEGNKRALCQRLGVTEYILWDPRYEYLTPPLQGYRLVGGRYRALRTDPRGCVKSRALGLRLCAEGHRLELYDGASGERLERPAEGAAAARLAVEAEQQRAAEMEKRARAAVQRASHAEQRASRADERASHAEQRASRSEAEVERLRSENARLGGGTS